MTAFDGHTPGPWRAVDQVGPVVAAAMGDPTELRLWKRPGTNPPPAARPRLNHYCPDYESGGDCPHDLEGQGSWSIEGPPPTQWIGDDVPCLARRVDAELAAAAPDLLAIVRHMLDGFDWNRPYGGWSVWDQVRNGLDEMATELTPEQVALLTRLVLPEVPDDGPG